MMEQQSIFDQVEKNVDRLVQEHVSWSACATPEQMEKARLGKPELLFGEDDFIPAPWLSNLQGKRVLCLAGAGGLQGPLLAAAGAHVTVLDLSTQMLAHDRAMALQWKLSMNIRRGNMCDLSCFEEASFDLVINPPSLFYVPDVVPVFHQVHRVLRPGGSFILCSSSPIAYVCEYDEDRKQYIACNRMPYRSQEHASQGDWVEYGHTMESYLGGLIGAGFVITGYKEKQMDDLTELYFLVKADKS